MQRRTLGQGLSVSAIGLGCMGMSEFYGPHDDDESLSVLHRATDLGVSFLDTAETYGSYHNEELVGRFIKQTSQPLEIATKFGIVRKPGEYKRVIDNSADYVRSACEGSLKRLGLESIDLYYVHRIDKSQPIEDVMTTLSKLVAEGKVKHIGLCEVSASTLRRAHAVHPVSAVQTEYSLWTRDVEEDILPTCKELGVGFVPYSPLGRGFLTGTYNQSTTFADDDFRANLPRFSDENIATNLAIVDCIRGFATAKQCTPAQLSLAWLLTRGEHVVPIPGTRRIPYLEENTASVDVSFTETELNQLDTAMDELTVAGERYTEEGMKGLNA
ncbi:MAG: aldo/keto reductase [Gammaproteobacteria bacterium]|nr:aldo/keto reductase [Gammaproteobacteria bacterium]